MITFFELIRIATHLKTVMIQPELGIKIVELRQAKGLTQTELASSCNLSLRTIQRIEASEVTPRAYTIKQIFEALGESDYFDSKEKDHSKPPFYQNWFSNDYSPILTSNKMRIIVAFTILFSSIGVAFYGISQYLQTKNSYSEKTGTNEIDFNIISLFNSGDIDAIGDVYMGNATMMPLNHEVLHGRDEIKAYYQVVYESDFRLVSEKINSIQISDSLAIETGKWTGYNGQPFEGFYMAQWKKIQGKWYIEHYITNYAEEY